MSDWLPAFLVTSSYLFFALLIGLMAGRRSSQSTVGYVAGDRALGTLVLYFIMGASIFSAFAFLGGPGWAYSRGAAAFYIISYGTVGLIPWYSIGPRIARLGRRFGYVTQAEFLRHRYESGAISAVLAVISVVAFIPYLTLQMQGAGYVFWVVTDRNIPVWGGAAIAYGVVLIYVFRSGVMGVAWTNTFQGILMMGLAWGLGLYLPYRLHGGVGSMFEKLAETVPEMLRAPGLAGDGTLWSWGGYTSAIVISAVGFSMWPHYFMKIYTARSIRTLKKTVVLYPTFQLFIVPILFIGFAGILAFPGVEPADTILPTIVTSLDLNPLIVGLFCAGALAASMSTGDALLHSAAAILVRDFYAVFRSVPLEDKKETRLIRILVILIGTLAYYFAVISDLSLVYLLLISYGAIAQVFPAVIAGLYWRGSSRVGVLSGLVAGILVTVIWNLFPILQWQEIHPGIFGLLANMTCLVVISYLSHKPSADHLGLFYED